MLSTFFFVNLGLKKTAMLSTLTQLHAEQQTSSPGGWSNDSTDVIHMALPAAPSRHACMHADLACMQTRKLPACLSAAWYVPVIARLLAGFHKFAFSSNEIILARF